MSRPRPALVVLAALLFAACAPATSGPPPASAGLPPCDWVRVERVVDGDTIIADFDGESERVRYIGIDTPESVQPNQPVEPLGREASDRNVDLIDVEGGGWLCLERDVSERDRFERLLRHPWLPDGSLLTETLVREGLATVVTFPPDVKHHDSRLIPAQEQARLAAVGIWSD